MTDTYVSALIPPFMVEYERTAALYPNAPSGKLAALALTEATDVTDDPTVAAYLHRHGVDLKTALALAGPICLHPVRFGRRNIFSFHIDGEPALVAIVHDTDAETEIDLVAWAANDPSRFGTFLGATGVLGADQVINPASYFLGRPLACHRTPLAWLAAGCSGIVVLSASKARPLLVRRLGSLLAEDAAHACALVRALSPALTPDDVLIVVDADAGRAAA